MYGDRVGKADKMEVRFRLKRRPAKKGVDISEDSGPGPRTRGSEVIGGVDPNTR